MLDPLHCIKLDNKKYEFIAGWRFLNICKNLQIHKIHIVTHSINKTTKYDIQKISYAYLLKNMLLSPDKHLILAELSQTLELTSRKIRKELLESSYSFSGNRTTEKLFNVTRKAVKNQIKQSMKNKVEATSILDELFDEN